MSANKDNDNDNNKNDDIVIEYMGNDNDNNNSKSIQYASNTESDFGDNENIIDESPVIELNEMEEDEDSNFMEDDIIDELKSSQNRSKEIVYENLSKKSQEMLDNKNTIVIEKLDENGNIESNNNEELVFNEEASSDNIFEQPDSITIQENIALQESEKVYEDDFIYIQELQNQLLSDLPVTKQGLLYIQKRIEKEVLSLIALKHYGKSKNEKIKKGIQYNYDNKWIIPVSLDLHRVYITLKEDETIEGETSPVENMNNNNNENSGEVEGFVATREDLRGVEKVNQKDQMKELKKLLHRANIFQDEYTYQDYLNDVEKIIVPYLPKKTNPNEDSESPPPVNPENNPFHDNNNNNNNNNSENDQNGGVKQFPNDVGYYHKVNSSTSQQESIRFYDIDSIYWNIHKNLPEFLTFDNLLDPNDHIQGIVSSTLVSGEETNTVGFLVLPHAGINIQNLDLLYTPSNYSPNILSKSYKTVGNIEKVQISEDKNTIVVNLPNHGLSKDAHYIIIEDCDYVPSINGIHKSINIIDDNVITIKNKRKIPMIKEGTKGKLYSLDNLKFDKYKIKKENNNFIKEFVSTTYENGEESIEHMKLYLFDDMRVPNKQIYEEILQLCAPTVQEIIDLEENKLKECQTMDDMSEIFKPYGINMFDIHYSQFSVLEKILEENLKKKEQEIAKNIDEKLPKISFHNSDKKLMTNPNLFLADIYIDSPFIHKYYGKFVSFKQPEDSLFLRLQWITSQLDHGNLYFLYVLYENMDEFFDESMAEFVKSTLNLTVSQFDELDKRLKQEFDLRKKKEEICKLYNYEAYMVPSGSTVAD